MAFGKFVGEFVVRSPLNAQAISRLVNKGQAWTSELRRGRFTCAYDDARNLDKVLHADGKILEAWEEFIGGLNKPPFADYHAAEPGAARITSVQTLYVTGLLQTPAYAHALVRDERYAVERLERQALLSREKPPRLNVLLDESALRRGVGSREIMREQHEHLIAMSYRPNITIQVVPYTFLRSNESATETGDFTIATMPDLTAVAVMDTPRFGVTVTDPEVLADLVSEVATLQAYAMNVEDTRAFLHAVKGEVWT
ncbi:DUF5753 domain-containing protein [Actinomadura flavalba]|uniref:DUF5753 domain-containing protein n=1 Tax=Actinomadura flavalba TaxID=1120938 RepID=UPI0003791851|nr:DUF5753 domain-containing protein [Actinomadura flavalba]